MTEALLRMLVLVTAGLIAVLLLRRPARRVFGAGPAFTLWLLPLVLAFAPLLPRQLARAPLVVLPGLTVTPHMSGSAFAHAGAGVDWMLVLMGVWLAGAGFGLVRLAWHYASLRLGTRAGTSAWLAGVREAAPRLDPSRARMHAAGPAVLWALPRSLVLLPEDFVQRFGNLATRELVLRHELTHVRRGDAWWSLVMEIASALLWFHPLVWFARRRFRLDQELACDAASLRCLPTRTGDYARALLDSVAVQPAPALIPWLAEPQLKERIAMIARMQPNWLRRGLGFVAVAGLFAIGVFVSGVVTAAPPPPAASAPPASSATPGIASATAAGTQPPSVDVSFKNAHEPKYPAEALRKGEQGEVILDVTVNDAGIVTGVKVDEKHSHAAAILQQSAMAAAVGWKFKPGMKGGKPVGGVVRIPVSYALDGWEPTGSGHCAAGFTYRKGANGAYSCSGKSAVFKTKDGVQMIKAGKNEGAGGPVHVLMTPTKAVHHE